MRQCPDGSPTMPSANGSTDLRYVTAVEESGSGQVPDIAGLVSYYADTASIHGVQQVAGRKFYTCRRYIWLTLLVLMVCGLTLLMYWHFLRYASHPTVTVVKAHLRASLPFPAVTICNLNQFHANRIPGDPALRDLLYQLSDFSALKIVARPSMAPTLPSDRSQRVRTGEELRAFAMAAAHTLPAMLKFCVWKSVMRPCEELFNLTVTDIGVCFTFNADPLSGRLRAEDVGPLTGLRAYVDIEQDSYYFSMHTQAGLKVLLHEPGEAPLLVNKGFFVRPGTCTDVAIRREKRISLPSPYKAMGEAYCVDATEQAGFRAKGRYENYSYTQAACWRSCYVSKLVAMCGCRHFFAQGTERVCSVEEMKSCYLPNSETVSWEDVLDCDCRSSCREISYQTAVSFTDFASKFIIRQMVNANLSADPNFVRDNLIELRIYYDTLTESEVSQEPEMTIMGILGDVGGHMGLFLGASVLSVTEILEVVLLAVVASILRKRGSQQNAGGEANGSQTKGNNSLEAFDGSKQSHTAS